MSDEQPTPGRCGARRKRGGFCMSRPREGAKRCRMHGSGSAAKPGGRPIIHGLYSKKFRHLSADGREKLAKILDDPDLMDGKRAVALTQLVVEENYGQDADADLSLADALGRRQESAARQDRAQRVLVAGVVPLMTGLGEKMGDLLERYVPEADREKARDELRSHLHVLVAEVTTLGGE